MKRNFAASAFRPPTPAQGEVRPLTVSQLSEQIVKLLESRIGFVRVEGEVSNFRRPKSGHAYFVLKDENAALNAVCFKSAFDAFAGFVKDGAKIEIYGRVTAYRPRSEYQIIADSIREAGVGELMRRFLELRDRLKAEGLFDEDRKQPIPRLPRSVGIVTSSTGAALRDMVHVLRRRAPSLKIYLAACAVQGNAAPAEIVAAIQLLVRHGESDVILVGRGGGSIEDLWAFNDERVARAVAACTLPIVSGVGHETDTTLCDFAADLRAPTPSVAAEVVTSGYADLARELAQVDRRLGRSLQYRITELKSALAALADSYAMHRPLDQLRTALQRLDEWFMRAGQSSRQVMHRQRIDLGSILRNLERVAPARRLQERRVGYERLKHRLKGASPALYWIPKLDQSRAESRQLSRRGFVAARRVLEAKKMRLAGLDERLAAVSPESILQRGYSIITTLKGEKIVSRPDQVRPGQTLRVQSAGGEWRAAVLDSAPELFDDLQS